MKSRRLKYSRKPKKSKKLKKNKKTRKSRKSGGSNTTRSQQADQFRPLDGMSKEEEAREYKKNVNRNLSLIDKGKLALGRTVVKPVTVTLAGADKEGDDAKPLSRFAQAHVISDIELAEKTACSQLQEALNNARDEYNVNWYWSTENSGSKGKGYWIEPVLNTDGSHKLNDNNEEQWRVTVQKYKPIQKLTMTRFIGGRDRDWVEVDQNALHPNDRQAEFSINAFPRAYIKKEYGGNSRRKTAIGNNVRYASWRDVSGPQLVAENNSLEGGSYMRQELFEGDDGEEYNRRLQNELYDEALESGNRLPTRNILDLPSSTPSGVRATKIPTGEIIPVEARPITRGEHYMFGNIRACEIGLEELEARIAAELAEGNIQTKEQRDAAAAEAAKTAEEVEPKPKSRMSRMSSMIRSSGNRSNL